MQRKRLQLTSSRISRLRRCPCYLELAVEMSPLLCRQDSLGRTGSEEQWKVGSSQQLVGATSTINAVINYFGNTVSLG